MHVVGNGDEYRLHLGNFAVYDFEQFHQLIGVGRAVVGLARGAVGQFEFQQLADMVDETGGQYQAAFFIHQREAPRPQTIIIAIQPQFELLLAAQRIESADCFGALRVVGGFNAVLNPVAAWVKHGMQRAVIELQ